MDPSILYQNTSSTVILVDIPRSLEVAQHILHPPSSPAQASKERRRIVSNPPLSHPFPSHLPKTPKAIANYNLRHSPPSIQELLLRKHVEFALQEIGEGYHCDEWCLKRVAEDSPLSHGKDYSLKWKRTTRCRIREIKDCGSPISQDSATPNTTSEQTLGQDPEMEALDPNDLFFTNPSSSPITLNIQSPENNTPKQVYIPPHSTLLSGSLLSTLHMFTSHAPSLSNSNLFSLILLDPPWPNRSARRSSTYTRLSRDQTSISTLLSSLPLQDHLAPDGVIAVWITNREVFREMVLGTDGKEGEGEERERGVAGLFELWGVELIEEWIWIKTTANGQPIFDLEKGGWRKPWEVLLVGRKRSFEESCQGTGDVKRRIIAGVPDLHSRKPNLRGLFEKLLLKQGSGNGKEGEGKRYEALEIFARNLTAGWWSWGDEVLKFQDEDAWVDCDSGSDSAEVKDSSQDGEEEEDTL